MQGLISNLSGMYDKLQPWVPQHLTSKGTIAPRSIPTPSLQGLGRRVTMAS